MKTETFDPYRSFENPQEAVDYINEQDDPEAAAWEVIKANTEHGEAGFASEVLYEYFSSMPE